MAPLDLAALLTATAALGFVLGALLETHAARDRWAQRVAVLEARVQALAIARTSPA